MARDLERLILRISGDASELKRALQVSEGDVRSSAGKMEKAFGGVSGSLTKIAGALGAAFSVRYLADLATDALAAADALQDTADRIGIGVEALQELRFAASQADIEAGKLDTALAKLARTQSEAAIGEKEQAEAFASIGVAVKDAAGNLVPLEDLVPRVADGLSRLANQQDRVRISAELFGRGAGVEMVNVLQDGSRGLEEMATRAHELGVVLDADLVKRSAEAADQLDALKLAAGTPLQEALLSLAPVILQVADAARTGSQFIGDLIDQFRSVENMSTRGLRKQLVEAAQDLSDARDLVAQEQAKADAGQNRLEALSDYNRVVDEREKEVARLAAEIQRREAALAAPRPTPSPTTTPSGGGLVPPPAAVVSTRGDAQRDAERFARDAAREAKRLDEERKSFLAEIERGLATASGSRLGSLDFEREESLEKAREIFSNQEDLAAVERDINAIYETRVDRLFVDMVEGYEDSIDKASELGDTGQKTLDSLRDGAEEFGESLSRAFADALIDGELSFKGLGESFLRDFIAKGFEGLTGLATTALFGTGQGGDNGLLGDLLGTAIGGIFGGFFADGGRPPVGRASIVGERGPEWFVPDAPGTIVPRGAAMDGKSASIEIPVYVQNYTSAPVRVEQRRTGDGRAEIYAIIGDVINRDLASNGQISRGIATRFRLQPAGA